MLMLCAHGAAGGGGLERAHAVDLACARLQGQVGKEGEAGTLIPHVHGAAGGGGLERTGEPMR